MSRETARDVPGRPRVGSTWRKRRRLIRAAIRLPCEGWWKSPPLRAPALRGRRCAAASSTATCLSASPHAWSSAPWRSRTAATSRSPGAGLRSRCSGSRRSRWRSASAFEAGPLDRLFLGALAGLTVWIFLSLLWTSSVPGTVLEIERMLVYLACRHRRACSCSAAAPCLRCSSGLWLAATAVSTYGLATRLFPDQLGVFDPIAGSRLSDPVGYWNAFGILAAMGTLLALGLAARERPGRSAASPPDRRVLLLLTLYFTYSRGGWIAFFVGLAAAIAVDRQAAPADHDRARARPLAGDRDLGRLDVAGPHPPGRQAGRPPAATATAWR